MKRFPFLIGFAALLFLVTVIASCIKDPVQNEPVTPLLKQTISFVEEFTDVSTLASKGWILKNLSNPVGQTGWRQGRYEAATIVQQSDKFLGAVPYVGFPGYSLTKAPTDFISCDVSAVNEGTLSAWLISPVVPIKEGDQIVFYTRAADDANYPVYTKDRMQVRANFTDGSVNIIDTGAGNFSNLLLDINPGYIYNDPSSGSGNTGYPKVWTKYTITIDTLPGNSVSAARFAFRYYGVDAGLQGGSNADNYATIIGLDSLAFIHK